MQAIPELQEYISAWQRAKRELQRGLSVEEMIRNEMERVHGEGSVASVHVMASQDVLRNLFATYTKTKHKIVKLTEKYSAAICRREQRIELEKVSS